MAFPVKDWRDWPDRSTPRNAAAYKDLETRVTDYTDQEVAAAALRSGGLAVADIVGDGTVDDTAAILAALDALPDYSGGFGGGTVIIPPTPTNVVKVSAPIVLGAGQRLVGGAMQAPVIQGNFADNIISMVGDFTALENLYVKNTHANAAAQAVDVNSTSNTTLLRCYLQAACVDGTIIRVHDSYMTELRNCRTGGSGTGVCNAGLTADTGSNVLRLLNSSFTDTRSGARLLDLFTAEVMGCQFESLGGGTSDSYNGGLVLDKLKGGAILGNYLEAITGSAIATYHVLNYSHGVVIGGNSIQSSGNPQISTAGLQDSTVLPNHMTPGAGVPNPHGVWDGGNAGATNNVVHRQFLESGTGTAAVLPSGRGMNLAPAFFARLALAADTLMESQLEGESFNRYRVQADGAVLRGDGTAQPAVKFLAGSGTPEGAVTAAVGSIYQRTNGGAGTSMYVKESGTGNTGWVAK